MCTLKFIRIALLYEKSLFIQYLFTCREKRNKEKSGILVQKGSTQEDEHMEVSGKENTKSEEQVTVGAGHKKMKSSTPTRSFKKIMPMSDMEDSVSEDEIPKKKVNCY